MASQINGANERSGANFGKKREGRRRRRRRRFKFKGDECQILNLNLSRNLESRKFTILIVHGL